MPCNIDISKLVWPALAVLVAVVVVWWVYSAGQESAENDILKQNNAAREGADRGDDAVSSCPPGMFDFRAGECKRR